MSNTEPVMTEKQRDAIARGAIALGVGLPGVYLRMQAIIWMYDWHVRPVVRGPVLTIGKVFALYALFGLLLGPSYTDPEKPVWGKESTLPVFTGRLLGKMVFAPLLFLAVGWFLR